MRRGNDKSSDKPAFASERRRAVVAELPVRQPAFEASGTRPLLAEAERCIERLVNAVSEEHWEAIGDCDRSLAQVLEQLAQLLDEASAAEREMAKERLQSIYVLHEAAMETLSTTREDVRVQLAKLAKGRQAVALYDQSAGP